MKQTWRWFGPDDTVSLWDIRQAGASGVVTALYDIAPGEVWTSTDIATRQSEISIDPEGNPTTLTWDVVESLPISEAIKTAGPACDSHIDNWIQSMRNLAAAGIDLICYNFMPVLDWTRTDLASLTPTRATALRFDLVDFAVFDLHILARVGAGNDYADEVRAPAKARFSKMDSDEIQNLTNNILAGLPGAVESWTIDTLRDRLSAYKGIDHDQLRQNLLAFLQRVVPIAQELGVRICCHPDDPPWALLGLPRIMSTEADYRWLIDAVPSPANGITFCSGSLGARADNDLVGMVQRMGAHIHFIHLRNVTREDAGIPCSFHEAEHLAGSSDMVGIIQALLNEEARRKSAGEPNNNIPMRPDHGQNILNDASRRSAPGYPAIGRLKGLAELRGVITACMHYSNVT
jgi:mannonate dehydratase